jgi:peptide deformylase
VTGSPFPQRRDVLTYPDERLRVASATVGDIVEVQGLIRDLEYTMYYHRAVGIAAPQIGEHARVFVLDASMFGGRRTSNALVFVNPEIVASSEELERRREGCLSFPGRAIHVKRPRWVTLRFLDQDGVEQELCTQGDDLLSQAVQHEHDHLVGTLMIDLLDQKARRKLEREMQGP